VYREIKIVVTLTDLIHVIVIYCLLLISLSDWQTLPLLLKALKDMSDVVINRRQIIMTIITNSRSAAGKGLK